jgi:hypothetical protein
MAFPDKDRRGDKAKAKPEKKAVWCCQAKRGQAWARHKSADPAWWQSRGKFTTFTWQLRDIGRRSSLLRGMRVLESRSAIPPRPSSAIFPAVEGGSTFPRPWATSQCSIVACGTGKAGELGGVPVAESPLNKKAENGKVVALCSPRRSLVVAVTIMGAGWLSWIPVQGGLPAGAKGDCACLHATCATISDTVRNQCRYRNRVAAVVIVFMLLIKTKFGRMDKFCSRCRPARWSQWLFPVYAALWARWSAAVCQFALTIVRETWKCDHRQCGDSCP